MPRARGRKAYAGMGRVTESRWRLIAARLAGICVALAVGGVLLCFIVNGGQWYPAQRSRADLYLRDLGSMADLAERISSEDDLVRSTALLAISQHSMSLTDEDAVTIVDAVARGAPLSDEDLQLLGVIMKRRSALFTPLITQEVQGALPEVGKENVVKLAKLLTRKEKD